MGQLQQTWNQLLSSAQWGTAIAVHQPNVQAKRKEADELKKIKQDLPKLQEQKRALEDKIFEVGADYKVKGIPDEAWDYGRVADAQGNFIYENPRIKDYEKRIKQMETRYAHLSPAEYYETYGDERLKSEFSDEIQAAWGQEKAERKLNSQLGQRAKNKKKNAETRDMIFNYDAQVQINRIKYSASKEGQQRHVGQDMTEKIKKGAGNNGNK
jgi:hypothetical protein